MLLYMCPQCQRQERRILLGLLTRVRAWSMSRCVCTCIHTLPFHVCIGACVHVSQVSETWTKDIVVFTNTEWAAKYVTVCIYIQIGIGATVHVSQVSETRTKDIVGIAISGSVAKYVTVCMYTHIALPFGHRRYCTYVPSVRDKDAGHCWVY